MSLTSDVYQTAPWVEVLRNNRLEAEQNKELVMQNYINQLMQNKDYDPNAKVGFLDHITPWDTKNEKAVRMNNLINQINKDVYGIDISPYQQSNKKGIRKFLKGDKNYNETGVVGERKPSRPIHDKTFTGVPGPDDGYVDSLYE